MAVELFFAAVSAICAATQLMMKQEERLREFQILEQRASIPRRDLPPEYLRTLDELNTEARQAGENAFQSPEWSASTNPELVQIARTIPEPILEAMKNNVQRCWDRLHHFISNNEYTPHERRNAHMLARKCICDELTELRNYLDELPDDLQGYWNACGCPNPLQS